MADAVRDELTIQLVKADITQLNVDVIVNVVHADGTEISGNTERIIQAGGIEVQREFHQFQRTIKREPGVVHCASGGGDLKSKQILLVALPDIGPAPATCNIDNAVSSTVLACLRAAEHSCKIIAFPVIGIELYPLDVIARCMLEAVEEYEEEQKLEKKPTLETIVFAIYTGSKTYDDFVVETFDELYQSLYDVDSDTPKSDEHTDVQDLDETDSPTCFARPHKADVSDLENSSLEVDSCVPPSNLQNQPTSQLQPQKRRLPPLPQVKKRKKKRKSNENSQASIYCPIVVGDIGRQIADVIVCSVGESLELSKAGASDAVLKVGGKDLQNDLKKTYPDGRTPPDVVTITKSGQLQCEDVCCVVLSKKENVDQNLKDLEEVIMKCLKYADENKRNSLAFPALGTGKLKKKYQVDAVAKCMFQTVQRFSRNNKRTSIKSVLFVLRETDKSVVEAFRNESMQCEHGSNNTVPVRIRESYPTTWQPMQDKLFMMVKLQQECEEYKEIVNNLKRSMSETNMTEIQVERIQNSGLYMKYKAARKYMDHKNPGIENERTLWHGTNWDVVQSICINGFNRSYCGRNGSNYGKGTYFAKDASYSNKYTSRDNSGRRCLFLTRVLTGKFTQGTSGMVDVPNLPGNNNCMKYDSTVDNYQNPTMFVCFSDNHTYPKYLITYKLEEQPNHCHLM